MSNGSMTPSALRMIRLAMFTGVILFGAVAWYVSRGQTLPPIPAANVRVLSWAFTGLAAASLAALAVVRSLQAKATDMEKRGTYAVVGWALGEAPALLGAVIYLLTGSPVAFFTGVAVLLVAFVLVPVPED